MASRRARASGGHAAEASSTPRVFINYRREDASGHAGRLYDALAARLGREPVFMDVDAIRPGENFAEVLDRSVESCDVLIALIGRHWASAADREGRRRLERPEDYVRLELQTTLGSGRSRVIPALCRAPKCRPPTSFPRPCAVSRYARPSTSATPAGAAMSSASFASSRARPPSRNPGRGRRPRAGAGRRSPRWARWAPWRSRGSSS